MEPVAGALTRDTKGTLDAQEKRVDEHEAVKRRRLDVAREYKASVRGRADWDRVWHLGAWLEDDWLIGAIDANH